MAVRHGYGKIAGTDALVFAYDTGDTINSYRGRPTTNYGPADLASWSLESGDVKRIATGNYYKGQPTYNCRTALNTSWIAINTTISGLRTAAGSSGTVTMSCMVRNNNSSAYPVYAYIGHDFGSTRTIPANSDWQKIQWTVNQSNMNNDYVEFRPYTNTAEVYLEMTMPMVEVNVGNASQFVNGTRSATQGLLDLTGNSSIDLSNVSFNSNAQIVFDGSNDYISIPSSTVFDTQTVTVEVVVKPYATSQYGFWFEKGTVNTQYSLFIEGGSIVWRQASQSQYCSSSNLTANGWNHVVGTFKTGERITYVNGVIKAQDALVHTLATNQGAQYIGSYNSGGYHYNGEIAVVKVYNRVLTADEVASNYNHYKSRFNIS